jgi:hypothetical protein
MIPDFIVQYGNTKYKQGFFAGYSVGILVAITIAFAADAYKSPRGSDSIR